MAIDVKSGDMSVADFLKALERKEIKVNRDYQRSPKIWPRAAQAFLIETVVLGYPMPKLALHSVTDVAKRITIKEIVDGQQRTFALQDFIDGKIALPRNGDHPDAGRQFEGMSEEGKAAFLSYMLPIDVFVGATKEDIREAFRRINAYTAPLNPEEDRHASFQGPFKWFIYRLSSEYSLSMLRLGTYSEKALARMADAKLLTEVSHAYFHGITTTDKSKLKKLYRAHDKEGSFDEEDELLRRFTSAFELIFGLDGLAGTELVKPHHLYSLILAAIHVLDPVGSLQKHFSLETGADVDLVDARNGLATLEAALDTPEQYKDLGAFVTASEKATNTGQNRATRFAAMCRALLGNLAA